MLSCAVITRNSKATTWPNNACVIHLYERRYAPLTGVYYMYCRARKRPTMLVIGIYV